jgi:hypothetical protein
VVGKAIDPFAEGGIGKGEGVRDGLKALAFDDLTHGLGTAENTGFPGLLYEGVSGRERVIGKVQCEGPHMGVSSNKILQKYTNSMSHYPYSDTFRAYSSNTRIYGGAKGRFALLLTTAKPRFYVDKFGRSPKVTL